MPLRNLRNDYLIDRKVQKHDTFTGIEGVSEQDAAIQDSMGPIQDRTQRASRPDRHRRRRVPQAADGRGARALQTGAGAEGGRMRAGRYAVRAGGAVAAPDKDLDAVMTERFGHARGYVGNQYGLGD